MSSLEPDGSEHSEASKSSDEESEGSSSEEPVSILPVKEFAKLSLNDLQAIDLETCTDLSLLLTVLATESNDLALKAVLRIRRLLSIEGHPPITEVIEAGGVDVLHKAMKHSEEKIRFEATWSLTNLLSGTSEQTRTVLNCGCIPTLISMFTESETWQVKEQAIWAIGNIAGDCPRFRDEVLSGGGLTAILNNLREESQSFMKNACWTVSNLCRGKPVPDTQYLIDAGPFVVSHISIRGDEEVTSDLLWALSYITDAQADMPSLTDGKLAELMSFLTCPIRLCLPTLRSFGNIVSSSETKTPGLIANGLLPHLLRLLGHEKAAIRRETCWLLSNICAENENTIEHLLTAQIFPELVTIALRDEENVRREAMWAISNSCEHSRFDQKLQLLTQGIGKALMEGMKSEDKKIVSITIEGLEALNRDFQTARADQEFRRFVNVEKLISELKGEKDKGLKVAAGLLKSLAWLNPNDNEV